MKLIEKAKICTRCKHHTGGPGIWYAFAIPPPIDLPHECTSTGYSDHMTQCPVTGAIDYPNCSDMNPIGECKYWEEKLLPKPTPQPRPWWKFW